MRILVLFDLPVTTAKNRADYRAFRKFLVKSGYLMLQESVYAKLTPSGVTGDALIENVRKNSPPMGLIQVLKVTEKQYSKMEFIVGQHATDVINSDERIIIL